MDAQRYVSTSEAIAKLGVTKATLYYYIKKLKLGTHKFSLDRNAYLAQEDFETIKRLKEEASQRAGTKKDAA